MSRFHDNRGGMGMDTYMPRRGGGSGGPMRGGFMGNQNFRSHPFQNQNQNQNRRGGGNFNRSGNQGPQKPQQSQTNQAAGPAPSPGPAVTMKSPVQEQKPVQEEPKPFAATPKIPSPTLKPTVTTPQPNQANKNQDQQLKSPPANINSQQQMQTPQPSPKPAPQQAPQQNQKTQPQQAPQQNQKTPLQQAPQPNQKILPQQAPQQNQKILPQQAPQQNQSTAPLQAPQHNQSTGPQQATKPAPQQNQGKGPQQQSQNSGPQPGQGTPRPQQNQPGPRQSPQQQGPRGPQQNQRTGFQQNQRAGPPQNQRPPMAKFRAQREEPRAMETNKDETGEEQAKMEFKLSMLLKPGEKTYTQRCRLFVGNLPNDITEDEFKNMFAKYGEPSEVFINKGKGFGFIRLESRALAEIAKAELDDIPVKGRPLRVRFATHSAALSVKNLSPFVSNELLEEGFSQFGMVERAIVVVDDRGRSTGKGIVEFASKPAARKALDRCSEGVFLLTSSPRPVVVEPMEQVDDEDGLPEKLAQKNPRYQAERDQPPRFAHPGSFEYEYSKRWKSLDEMEKQQRQQVEKNMREAREKLESEMEDAYHEHQANMLRQDLLRRQEELRRMEEMHSQEMQKRKEMQMRQEEERRRREEEMLRKRELEEQMRRQREENYRMGNFMERERDMRMSSGSALSMGDVQFGTPNQKFGLSGIGFEGQQGMGGSPGLMNNEMRSERFAQGGPRGMGPGNPGYGRVREEFEGPTKKPRF